MNRILKISFFAFSVLFLSVGNAHAESDTFTSYYTTHELGGFCASEEEIEQSICYGFVMGVMDATSSYLGSGDVASPRYCFGDSEDETLGMIVKVFDAWVKEYPEIHSYRASDTILMMLQTEWPCSN